MLTNQFTDLFSHACAVFLEILQDFLLFIFSFLSFLDSSLCRITLVESTIMMILNGGVSNGMFLIPGVKGL